MKDYIHEWAHGEETNPQKQQVSARIDIEIVQRIEDLAAQFGINKTSVIEGALDVGTRFLLEEAHRATETVFRDAANAQGKGEEFEEMIKGAKDA